MNNKKVKAYITKDLSSNIELWAEKPIYRNDKDYFTAKNDVGSDICSEMFDNCLNEGECKEITIIIGKTIYGYNKTLKDKVMNIIFNKLKKK